MIYLTFARSAWQCQCTAPLASLWKDSSRSAFPTLRLFFCLPHSQVGFFAFPTLRLFFCLPHSQVGFFSSPLSGCFFFLPHSQVGFFSSIFLHFFSQVVFFAFPTLRFLCFPHPQVVPFLLFFIKFIGGGGSFPFMKIYEANFVYSGGLLATSNWHRKGLLRHRWNEFFSLFTMK